MSSTESGIKSRIARVLFPASYAKSRFETLTENLSDVFALLHADGRIVYESPGVERVLGYRAPQRVHTRSFAAEEFHEEDREAVEAFWQELFAHPGREFKVEARQPNITGDWCWLEITGKNLLKDNVLKAILLSYRDISSRKRLEEQLRQLAYHDPLTGLANRNLFQQRIHESLSQPETKSLAVLLLDLDDFKLVNDGLGHVAGDQLLMAAARRLENCVRPGDTVARMGGDEFSLLLPGADEASAVAAAKRVLASLNDPFRAVDRDIFVHGSVGVAVAGIETINLDELMRDVDIAMYQAKRRGKGCFAIFDPSMHDEALRRLALKEDLRVAVANNEVAVQYQPIFNLKTNRIVSFQAQPYWKHDQQGEIPVNELMTLAVEAGLVSELTGWLISESCRQAQEWSGQVSQAPSVSISIEPRALRHPDFIINVEAALADVSLPAGQLTLEFGERALLDDSSVTANNLTRLRELGVKLGLSDFGSGYGALSCLRTSHTSVMKLSSSLTSVASMHGEEAQLLQAIVQLAHALSNVAVAKDIQTADEAEALRELGVDWGKGPHFIGNLSGVESVSVLTAIDRLQKNASTTAPSLAGIERRADAPARERRRTQS